MSLLNLNLLCGSSSSSLFLPCIYWGAGLVVSSSRSTCWTLLNAFAFPVSLKTFLFFCTSRNWEWDPKAWSGQVWLLPQVLIIAVRSFPGKYIMFNFFFSFSASCFCSCNKQCFSFFIILSLVFQGQDKLKIASLFRCWEGGLPSDSGRFLVWRRQQWCLVSRPAGQPGVTGVSRVPKWAES